MRIESLPWAFQRAMKQGRMPPPNFAEMGFSYRNLSFFAEISTQPLKICYNVSMSKNFQRQIVVQLTTNRTVSTFRQGTLFP